MASHNQVSPITVLTPVRRFWYWWLRLTWPGADRGLWIKRPTLRLKFIHVAHWGLVDRLPMGAPSRPYILFQSNFDGPAREYAEAFALGLPWRIRGLWAGGYGFPGPRPSNDFVDYVLEHAVNERYHYYARSPTATVRTVRAALELNASFERFRSETKKLGPDEFAEAWERFLTREQHNL